MEIYCKDDYKSIKDLMRKVYNLVFDDEKDGFSVEDATTMILFNLALDALCKNFMKEITKECEEE